jgi:hypothetical protein
LPSFEAREINGLFHSLILGINKIPEAANRPATSGMIRRVMRKTTVIMIVKISRSNKIQ